MGPTKMEIKQAWNNSNDLNLKEISHPQNTDSFSRFCQNVLVGVEAAKALKGNQPPLIWLDDEFAHLSHSKEIIKYWMTGNDQEFSKRNLITDRYCVAGFEADIVIYLGDLHECDFISRTRGQFIKIP